MTTQPTFNMTTYLPCICKNPDEDKLYGKHMRTHKYTRLHGADKEWGWVCQTCFTSTPKTPKQSLNTKHDKSRKSHNPE